MNSRRIRNVVFLAVAGLVGVVVIALLSAKPASNTDSPAADRAAEALSPQQQPPSLTEPATGEPDVGALGVNEGTIIQVTDPKTGALAKEFMWQRMTPHEQGVFDLVGPQARFYLEPWRVIHMRSDEGRFVAPGNHPQSGEFRKNVIVDIFQTEKNAVADLSEDSADRVLQIKLDQATFDTTLGELKSDGRVEVRTPATDQVSFKGKGLRLLYNELSRRIDYLEITEGEAIHYRPLPTTTEDKAQQTAANRKPAKADDPQGLPEPPHYYKVEFDSRIKVTRGEQTIEADKLLVYFAVDPHGNEDPLELQKVTQKDAVTSLAMRHVMRATTLLIGQVAQPLAASPPGLPKTPETSAPREPALLAGIVPGVPGASPTDPQEEIVLTWSGKMVMTPVEFPPPMLRQAEDVYAQFEGSPVRISAAAVAVNEEANASSSRGGEQMVCRMLEFMQPAGQAGRVTATGNDAYPLLINSPQMRATADRFVANLDNNTARLIGPGTLRGPDESAATIKDESSQLPPDFKVAWSESVDLTFSDPKQKDAGIETARFIGDVRIDDPQFKLRSRELTVTFGTPAPGKQTAGADVGEAQRQIKHLNAAGQVRIEMDQARIAADKLDIETAPGTNGRLAPSRMIATGNVNVIDPQQQISSKLLTVTLAEKTIAAAASATPKPAASGGATPSGGAAKPSLQDRLDLEVRTITATEDVRLTREGSVITADRLDADALAGSAVLTGSPVVILHQPPADDKSKKPEPTSELRVPMLRLTEDGKVVRSEGAGTMIYTEPDNTEAAYKGRRVKVTWTRSMNFDDKANLLHVAGDVVVESEDSPRELNRIKADDMTLELIDERALAAALGKDQPKAVDAVGSGDATTGNVELDAPLGSRRLQRVVARGNVELLATTWTDATRQAIDTRFFLAGPLLTFRNADEMAQIVGPGRMLLEDYRIKREGGSEIAGRRMSGNGLTAFTWTESLTMDGTRSDLTILGNVQMTHSPQDTKDIIQLDCDRLYADMVKQGKLAATAMSKVESMNIRAIDATGHVRITADNGNDTVSADRLVYDGVTQDVILKSEGQSRVTVTRAALIKPLRGKTIRWNLKSDEFEILEAGL